jgi:hypothetical protein
MQFPASGNAHCTVLTLQLFDAQSVFGRLRSSTGCHDYFVAVVLVPVIKN